MSSVTAWMRTPSQPRRVSPNWRNCSTSGARSRRTEPRSRCRSSRRVGEMIAVLMPMTSPSMLNSGPPELPRLMAASVCEIVVIGAGIDVAVAGRDDAERHRAAEAERDCRSPAPSRRRAACRCRRNARPSAACGLDLQDREIDLLVAAEKLGLKLGAVVEIDLDIVGVVDDVVVGDDDSRTGSMTKPEPSDDGFAAGAARHSCRSLKNSLKKSSKGVPAAVAASAAAVASLPSPPPCRRRRRSAWSRCSRRCRSAALKGPRRTEGLPLPGAAAECTSIGLAGKRRRRAGGAERGAPGAWYRLASDSSRKAAKRSKDRARLMSGAFPAIFRPRMRRSVTPKGIPRNVLPCANLGGKPQITANEPDDGNAEHRRDDAGDAQLLAWERRRRQSSCAGRHPERPERSSPRSRMRGRWP